MSKKPKMTYAQFLAALRKTPRDWRLSGAMIRRGPRNEQRQCPITSLVALNADCLSIAAEKLGIRPILKSSIYRAADGWSCGKTRRDLLKACGLDKK